MNSIFLNNLFLFSAGAAIGSVVTWKLLKTKYEQIAQEEIDSVKERFASKHKEIVENVENAPDENVTYNKIVEDCAYNKISNEIKKEEVEDVERPYVISPDEFGEMDDYEVNTLYYYADGVLTDDMSNVIDDVDDIVGEDAFDHFGEYEDDSVFVRNDRLRSDYEILRDERRYSDVEA